MHVNVAVDTFTSQPLIKKITHVCFTGDKCCKRLQGFHIRFSTKGCIVLAAFEVVGVNSNENFKNKTQNLDNKEEKHAFLEKLASDIVNMCVATTTFKLTDEEHNCQRRNVYHVAFQVVLRVLL
jgi:hypothetical protein